MKGLVNFIGLVVSFNLFGMSHGLPEQDEIIRDLRERFSKARLPTVDELVTVKNWKCTEFIAARDNYEIYDDIKIKFKVFDKFIISISESEGFNNRYLAFKDNELFATWWDSDYGFKQSAYRIDQNGSLVNEYGYAPPHSSMELVPYARSLYGNTRVASYMVCTKEI